MAALTRPAGSQLTTPPVVSSWPSCSGRATPPPRPLAARMRRASTPPPRACLRPPRAGLRLVEPGDGDSDVPYTSTDQAAAFAAALADPELCATVLAQAKAAGKGGEGATRAVWVPGAAFVPSAWSPATPRGVPPAWNDLAGREDHVVIQVPPPVTYSVRVPGRVCAIYRLE